jgi:aspartyl aminopeptidase
MDPLLGRFLSFLEESPTPWHAVDSAARLLAQHGFVEVDEGGAQSALPPGACGFVRRGGSVVAFRIGAMPLPAAGFRLISAHTDSPNLRIKPQPLQRSHGWIRLGVEVYGGAITATWADRDLGIAGLVVVRDGASQERRLVRAARPICRTPNLAIHLNRKVNDDGLILNAQTQLPPVFALEAPGLAEDPLRELLAEELGCKPADILTWDLSLFDLAKPTLGGLQDEFVFSARLDNLASSHAALEALVAAQDTPPPAFTAVIALFDHEEVGSTSARGACSRLLESTLDRLLADTTEHASGGLARTVSHSWHVSADMAHAVHPGYADKHEPQHMPQLNRGPVIKQNASQRYGTEPETAGLFVRLCEAAEVPYQWFVTRSDLACGSTVGPLVAAQLGLRTVDVGNPMVSMHSIREMCGSRDHASMVRVLTRFLAAEH